MMKKLFAFAPTLALVIALGAAAAAAVSAQNGKSADEAGAVAIGQKVDDFTLSDLNGKSRKLSSLRGAKGTVLIFISVQCPISNAYNERMEKLAQDYASRGISVIGINSNFTEPAEAVRNHAAEHHLTFTILKDNGNRVADLLGAQHTPEAFLLDASGKLVYRGRIDNARNVENISTNDLRDAMDATLAGQPVKNPEARAFGCSIKRAS